MKRIGFPISNKENENRRAILPEHLSQVKHPEYLCFEQGYGDVLGYSDQDYINAGAMLADRATVLQMPILCDPKIGDADYLEQLHDQTLFGWVHAVQNRDITDKMMASSLTAYAWEDMYYKGKHVFWRNNELAGEAAIMHAFQCHAKMPYHTKVALVGRGNVASGALKILTLLGADVTVYGRNTEALLQEELPLYDVVVNALLWDVYRTDHIISYDDLNRMKKGAMIVDISCDRHGAIESSVPTTIQNPVYYERGILHYVVDHTPSLFYKTTSESISAEVVKYVDLLIEGQENTILTHAKCMEKGNILDQRICDFQKR